MKRKIIAWFIFILAFGCVSAQEIDITAALKKIEAGEISDAEKLLEQYKEKNEKDPSVIFLDAVLTMNGDEAARKYSIILDKYPKSKYADASIYRLFSYYYSLGSYKKAEALYNRLKIDFPQSSYTIIANRTLPAKEEIEPKIAKEKPVAQAAAADSSRYIIQTGAFLNLDNATRLGDQLKNDGYSVAITSKDVGGTILNVVSIGEFDSESEAQKILASIEGKYKLKGRIIQK